MSQEVAETIQRQALEEKARAEWDKDFGHCFPDLSKVTFEIFK